jgi:hypothetical protein
LGNKTRTEFKPAHAIQSAKRGTKEATRQQILETTLPLPGTNTITNWVEVNKLVKEKQAAVSHIMLPPKKQAPKVTPEVSRIKKKSVKVAAKKKARTTKKKGNAKATKAQQAATLTNITNTYTAPVRRPVQLCGCRHGDLSVLKSFIKAEAMYYTRPNRYLERKGCLDCKRAILDMRPATTSQKAVVFYCDQGIKGFDAPDDDPMKAMLTCNLVFCPQCEAIRRITFEKGNEGRRGGGRKRNRPN